MEDQEEERFDKGWSRFYVSGRSGGSIHEYRVKIRCSELVDYLEDEIAASGRKEEERNLGEAALDVLRELLGVARQ
ncbi:MAG: hypothetical protein AAF662_05530 [Pseudomonadota bacterium]